MTTFAWELISTIWEWIVGAGAGGAAVFGWFRWGRKKELTNDDEPASGLSLVRTIAGPASNEMGLMLADAVKAWRMNNLIRISGKFDRICKEKGLSDKDLHSLNVAVGLAMLEKASYEEDDELQEIWANLMVSATSDPNHTDDDLYRTWINFLSQMSRWDCHLLSVVVEEGISSMEDGSMLANPLSEEDIQGIADMPRVRVDMHLQKLTSLGLIYRDPTTPLKTGGPTGLQYSYTPTHLGMNMYMNCGNTPKWFAGRDSLPAG